MRVIDYAALDALAASLMAGRKAHLLREKGFIYRHGQRAAVAVIALRRLATEDKAHDDALRVAAMFHDVGKGIEPHARTGAAIARVELAPYLTQALLEEVAFLIGEHTNHQTDNLWAKLLQDADLMDHFGSVEIGLSFQYGAYTENGMPETLAWYMEGFEPYAARSRQRLNFDFSRPIFDEKVGFTREFIQRLQVELHGQYTDPAPSGKK